MTLTSIEDAVSRIRPVDTLGLPLGPGQPVGFLHALGERDDFVDLQVSSALLVGLFALFTRPGVRLRSGFFGPVERGLVRAGHVVDFVPGDFRRFARIVRELDPRVMATAVTPPDSEGFMSLSLHAGATIEELRMCGRDPSRLLIAEVNPRLPRTQGILPAYRHALHAGEVDVLIESDALPPEIPEPPSTPEAEAIASHVQRWVPDGATLQTGIGALPSAIVHRLAEGPGGDYGIHSEMFTTGLMQLHLAGKVTNRKGLFDGFSITTFSLGSAELYAWLDGSDAVRFLPVDVVNSAEVIGRNRNMVSINGALSVDLAGQVVADQIGGVQHSGIGGHEDFTAGAGLARGGRSLVCMPSTAWVGGQRVSRIVTQHPAGAMITTPRHQVDVIVTEYGAAELSARTVAERREALAAIAHPDVRDALRAGEPELSPIANVDRAGAG